MTLWPRSAAVAELWAYTVFATLGCDLTPIVGMADVHRHIDTTFGMAKQETVQSDYEERKPIGWTHCMTRVR